VADPVAYDNWIRSRDNQTRDVAQFRLSFATNLKDGYDIRTIRELLRYNI